MSCTACMTFLPLIGRDESVRGWSMVDHEDYERLRENHYRLLCAEGLRYARRWDGEQVIYLHREILGLEPGDPRSVDHINRDGLDNRRSNLRLATTAQNGQNRPSQHGSSRFRGVSWDKSRRAWKAQTKLNGVTYNLGHFAVEEDAAEASRAWRVKHMPFTTEEAPD